ncbi:MAG: hypothetical protein NZ740_00010 [Kiritimatiellae bacterium]|nr:hypothetical protein [Kiritimatiellia bacterium]MDW8457474.1 hypothetical protein [Verrucomicrobiota bacterium]
MKRLLMLMGWVIGLAAAPVSANGTIEIEAMRILASNEPAPLDRRLERVDYILRPLLRFETYRLLGMGSVILHTPGEAAIDLGEGHVLSVRAGRDRGSHVEVIWYRDDRRLLSTSIKLQRGRPAILGGVPHGEGRLIVTITAK